MTEFLDAASRIGDRLCAEAFWADDRTCCSWMGRTDVEDASQAASQLSSRAVGPHIYGGSGGIALFLLELARATGRDIYAATAVGAVVHAISAFRRDAGRASPLSHFVGVLGLGAVIGRAAAVTGTDAFDRDLDRDLDWAIGAARGGLAESHAIDVMGGEAGAIPPLLQMWRHLGRRDCFDLAVACGGEICRTAAWSGSMCAWPSEVSGGPLFQSAPVTGYSHGASGLALALLELHAAGAGIGADTGGALATARSAWLYEDGLFSPEVGNWIDVRFPFSFEDGVHRGTFHAAWCHGAAGIALARARAAALDVEGEADHRRMAAIALRTTLAAMERNFAVPGHDASLCHGLSGLGEIALTCGQLLGEAAWGDAARSFGERLVALNRGSRPWPSGAPSGGPNPTLMLGDAGIGYHLLRLHAPDAVPPILITLPDGPPSTPSAAGRNP